MNFDEREALIEALQKFSDMSILEFSAFLKSKRRSRPKAATNPADHYRVSEKLKELKGQPKLFEAELEPLKKDRSFTKKDLQTLYLALFDTKSSLPSSLTKPQMIERIKRQRRREANFASA